MKKKSDIELKALQDEEKKKFDETKLRIEEKK